MTGTLLSQAIPILTAPFLARLYSPSDYGILGLYMSITGLISMFTTLQYSNAIIVAKTDDEVKGLMNLCLRINSIFALIILVLTILLHKSIAGWLDTEQLQYWLFAAPFSIFMGGLSLIFGNFAIRTKQFGLVSRNRVYSTVASTTFSLSIGYLTHHTAGLFIGLWVNQLINGLLLSTQSLKKTSVNWKEIIKSNYNAVRRKYINFPKFNLPSDFLNNFTNQIPVYFLNAFGTTATVGSYNMGNRILGLPIIFISSAMSEVFRQQAAEDYNKNGSCREIFMRTFKALSLTSVLPFIILIIFAPQLFTIFLGEKWLEAGKFAQILSIMYFFRFTASPLSYVFYITQRLKENLILQFIFLLISISSFYFGYILTRSVYQSLLLFSIGYSLIYVYNLIRTYQLSAKPANRN